MLGTDAVEALRSPGPFGAAWSLHTFAASQPKLRRLRCCADASGVFCGCIPSAARRLRAHAVAASVGYSTLRPPPPPPQKKISRFLGLIMGVIGPIMAHAVAEHLRIPWLPAYASWACFAEANGTFRMSTGCRLILCLHTCTLNPKP